MQIRNLTSQADGQPVAPATAKKRIYFSPEIVIMEMEAVSHLMDTSYAGQHNPATPGQGPAPVPVPASTLWKKEMASSNIGRITKHYNNNS